MSTSSEIIPRLASLYQQGLLVPFIGSGMSSPACSSWTVFLKSLAAELGIDADPYFKNNEAGPKYRLADKIVARLVHAPPITAAKIYRNALKTDNSIQSLTATSELAKLHWPLVITTNYDDIYCAAAHLENSTRTKAFYQEVPKATDFNAPEIAGRTIADCHKVLRSLDSSFSPLLWAVQGYVGGIVQEPNAFEKNQQKLDELTKQIVVGHRQYQRAINEHAHFRRAFAEVCRRRSLLFLGSGIAEDYLLNLFAEVVHHHGLSTHGHYALFPQSRAADVDNQFLSTRLGITPVFYDDRNNHAELRNFLTSLREQASLSLFDRQHSPSLFAPSELTFRAGNNIEVTLKHSPLNESCCDAANALLLSVGREFDNSPRLGNQVISVIGSSQPQDWYAVDHQPSYFYRNNKNPYVHAIAARDRDSVRPSRDIRSLHCIPEALSLAFSEISKSFQKIHMGAVASGKANYCHPIHPFVQMLRGVRLFLQKNNSAESSLKNISIYIVHPGVWADIVSNKLSILENLNSDLAPVNVEVHSGIDQPEFYTLTLPYGPTIEEVIIHLGMLPTEWAWELHPPPGDFSNVEITKEEKILPTMILRLSPKPPDFENQ